MSLPQAKVQKAVDMIKHMLSSQKTTVKQVQSVAGLLNYCTKIVPSGRAFLRRLYDLTSSAQQPFHHIRVTAAVKADLRVWLSFLTQFNCRAIIVREVWLEENVLHCFTDSSKRGYGGFYGSQWFNGHFPDSWAKVNIAIKEFVAAYLAWKLWFQHLNNVWVEFHIDNESVVYNMLNQTSHLDEIMVMLREIVLFSMYNNVQFKATYIRSKLNWVADKLSRFQVDLARTRAPYLNRDPCPVPAEWLPWNLQQ